MTTTKKKPAPFSKLSKAQQRVAIAKDALLQLRNGKYTRYVGYIESTLKMDTALKHADDNTQLSSVLKRIHPTCGVCARGALLLSTIRKANDILVCDMPYRKLDSLIGKRYEVKVFPRVMLEEIEVELEFERGPFSTRNRRLRAIIENIIRNNGTFKPSDTGAKS